MASNKPITTGRIPRYTSYPTALEMVPGFPAAAALEALRTTNDALIPPNLALYIHIPFCRELCWYCGCNKVVTRHDHPLDNYMAHLETEIRRVSDCVDKDRQVALVQLGGGTPNSFGTERLEHLLRTLRSHFNWADDVDMGIELDPRLADIDQLRRLHGMGFTRVSFGVQDLDLKVQQAINRVQSCAHVLALVSAAKQLGFASVNTDLVYGLPLQTAASVTDTIERLATAGADRFALFEYAHLPQVFRAQRLLERCHIPSNDEAAALFESGKRALARAGYERLGLDHFAKPGDPLLRARDDGALRRGFQGYYAGSNLDLIGFGASAISEYGDVIVQNERRLQDYASALDTKVAAYARGRVKSNEDLIRARWIEQLMCHGRAERNAVKPSGLTTQVWRAAQHRAQAARLAVQWDETTFEVLPAQWDSLRQAAWAFDGYRPAKIGAAT